VSWPEEFSLSVPNEPHVAFGSLEEVRFYVWQGVRVVDFLLGGPVGGVGCRVEEVEGHVDGDVGYGDVVGRSGARFSDADEYFFVFEGVDAWGVGVEEGCGSFAGDGVVVVCGDECVREAWELFRYEESCGVEGGERKEEK